MKSLGIDTTIEVWASDNTLYSRNFYFVVLSNTATIIREAKFSQLQEELGTKLLLINADSLSVLIDKAQANDE